MGLTHSFSWRFRTLSTVRAGRTVAAERARKKTTQICILHSPLRVPRVRARARRFVRVRFA